MLRAGKTKSTIEGSIDAALLAVEVFNKPRTTFRTEAFVSLMIVAWTRLFHAHFNQTIGNKYYYKKKGSNRYEMLDGERKAWELKTCISKYGKLSDAETANLHFFIKLRNKIQHRYVDKREMDTLLFGECQSLLFNYETTLTELFGKEFSINESLTYSLQFSMIRTSEQEVASKRALSADMADIKKFVDTYRSNLPQEVFDSQEYSLKLIQVPRISNTKRNDVAIEFVRWDSLDSKDRATYKKLNAIIKNKIVKQPVFNLGGMKPGKVLKKVRQKTQVDLSHYDHRCLFVIFKVRPDTGSEGDPFETDTRYCHYDEVHDDYIYNEAWVEALISFLQADKMKDYQWKQAYKSGRRYDLDNYL